MGKFIEEFYYGNIDPQGKRLALINDYTFFHTSNLITLNSEFSNFVRPPYGGIKICVLRTQIAPSALWKISDLKS